MHYMLRPATLRHVLIVPVLMLAAALSAGVVFAHPVEQSTHSTPSTTQTPEGCTAVWNVVTSPNGSTYRNRLRSIEVISTTDIWAVGSQEQSQGQLPLTLIEHWDGTQWSVVPSPNPAGGVELYGVSAAASGDVWAVGGTTTSPTRTIIEHWNGTTWSIVPSPNVGSYSTLHGVTAISETDVWAVGYHAEGALTLHWNGIIWSIIPNPSVRSMYLQAVSSLSSNDVWAVGDYISETLTMHWNGTQWSIVPSPNTGIRNLLYGVEVISANDVWAVGEYNSDGFHSLTLHWDGTSWSSVPNTATARLKSVAATAANDVWAVGGYYMGGSTYNTTTMHWDGTQWTEVASPNPDPSNNRLYAIDTVSSNEVWAVGFQGAMLQGSPQSTLVMRYTGTCLTPTLPPTNTATPQPPTSTSTSVMPTPTCGPAWEIVSSPNVTTTNILHSVALVSPSDIWAVGVYDDGSRAYTLIEHWDGSSWSIVPSPIVGDGNSLLNAVTAISPTDVWAVGFYAEAGVGRTLALHWDGIAWTHVPTPNVNGQGGSFSALTAVGPDDVWAVGSMGSPTSYTLIQHWDGTQWNIVPSPNPGLTINELYGVTAISSNDVWAVGVANPGHLSGTLTLHWDGQNWSVVPSLNVGSGGNVLWAVSAVSSNDVWAVGGYGVGPGVVHALIQHWNGNEWSLIPGAANEAWHVLYSIDAVSDTDVWAVGWTHEESLSRTLIEHWDGTQWSTTLSPNGGTSNNALYGVSATQAGSAWAVGVHTSLNTASTLVEKYANPCATPAPTVTPFITATNTPSPSRTATTTVSSPTTTNTVVLPTLTSTPSTGTNTAVVASLTPTSTVGIATPTPTACAVEFTDVPVENAFYSFVRCLACRGIISGYADGTFRPNNQVTRGQLAKMVSSAAGFNEPVTGQTFEDVPSTNTFYHWIERLVTRGHMTGYLCGNAGEPCITGKPYFRPFANATRGQTAKIVANAAGFNEMPVGQTFEDVPASGTFYTFIQRLATRNVMGGYPCGDPGEPCISGKPYFRPNNNVTRGQSAKIVANTFFPSCNP